MFGLRRWSDTQDGAGLELSASDFVISATRPTSESGTPISRPSSAVSMFLVVALVPASTKTVVVHGSTSETSQG